jgi:type I restriction enzyme S subunit
LPNIGIVEQRRIASVLSAYDDLIENNRQRIALLEEAARLLYKEWFVHLRFPGHEHVKITNDVPEGWKRVELFDEADALYGFAFKSKQFSEDGEGTPVVRIRDIPDGVSKTYTLEEAPKDKLLDDGDFLIGMDGIFHQNYWVGGRAWINQRVVRISSKGVLSNGYLRQAVRKPIEDFNETITGTTVAHLGAKHLKIIKVLVPPKHLLEDANEFFENTRSQFIKLSKQNQELIKARDVLLPRLMDGRLEI